MRQPPVLVKPKLPDNEAAIGMADRVSESDADDAVDD